MGCIYDDIILKAHLAFLREAEDVCRKCETWTRSLNQVTRCLNSTLFSIIWCLNSTSAFWICTRFLALIQLHLAQEMSSHMTPLNLSCFCIENLGLSRVSFMLLYSSSCDCVPVVVASCMVWKRVLRFQPRLLNSKNLTCRCLECRKISLLWTTQ
jgi:hypothetical protein